MKAVTLDYIIVGAGPSGLQLGYYFQQQQQVSYLILERNKIAGSFFDRYPRHRKLISINKVYTGYEDPEINLRWDWNSLLEQDDFSFTRYSKAYFPDASHYVTYLNDYAKRFRLNIAYETDVIQISKQNQTFVVQCKQDKVFFAKYVIIASGLFKPYIPDIPGIEHAETYNDMSVNPQDFINQRVCVIGKGNSGFETADNLIETAKMIHIVSPSSLNMAWKTHFVGHLRAINNNFLDTYQLKAQNALIDATIKKIERINDEYQITYLYSHAENAIETLCYDRIFLCAGNQFDCSIFAENLRPDMVINHRFPNQTSTWESTNIPNLFFAGVLTQVRDYKKYMSAFIHGFRYNARTLYHLLIQRHLGKPYPTQTCHADTVELTDYMLNRINHTSALWQQPGYLSDVFVINPANQQQVTHYEELPVDYVPEVLMEEDNSVFVLTLEYGPQIGQDIFSSSRIRRDNTANSHCSSFLHPVIKFYHQGQFYAEHHVIEDLMAEWKEPEHSEPLRQFLEVQLNSPQKFKVKKCVLIDEPD